MPSDRETVASVPVTPDPPCGVVPAATVTGIHSETHAPTHFTVPSRSWSETYTGWPAETTSASLTEPTVCTVSVADPAGEPPVFPVPPPPVECAPVAQPAAVSATPAARPNINFTRRISGTSFHRA